MSKNNFSIINLLEKPFVTIEPVRIPIEYITNRKTSIDVGVFNLFNAVGPDMQEPQAQPVLAAAQKIVSTVAAAPPVGEQTAAEAQQFLQQPEQHTATPTTTPEATSNPLFTDVESSLAGLDTTAATLAESPQDQAAYLRQLTGIDEQEEKDMERRARAAVAQAQDEVDQTRVNT